SGTLWIRSSTSDRMRRSSNTHFVPMRCADQSERYEASSPASAPSSIPAARSSVRCQLRARSLLSTYHRRSARSIDGEFSGGVRTSVPLGRSFSVDIGIAHPRLIRPVGRRGRLRCSRLTTYMRGNRDLKASLSRLAVLLTARSPILLHPHGHGAPSRSRHMPAPATGDSSLLCNSCFSIPQIGEG